MCECDLCEWGEQGWGRWGGAPWATQSLQRSWASHTRQWTMGAILKTVISDLELESLSKLESLLYYYRVHCNVWLFRLISQGTLFLILKWQKVMPLSEALEVIEWSHLWLLLRTTTHLVVAVVYMSANKFRVNVEVYGFFKQEIIFNLYMPKFIKQTLLDFKA
jgi:hypothetical protein